MNDSNIDESEKSELDSFFDSLREENSMDTPANAYQEDELIDKIINVGKQPRILLNADFNFFEYYENLKSKNPELFELAIVVGSAPATQVSVERAFSAMRLLLHHTRFNLSPNQIDDILLCNLNRDLFDSLNFNDF